MKAIATKTVSIGNKTYRLRNILFIIIGLALIIEIIRDSFRDGDFIGYLNAGNLVLSSENIYSDYLNTWPPFFSITSVILAIGDQISPFLIRLIWLLGSTFALYGIVNYITKIIYDKPITYAPKKNAIIIQDAIVFVPLLLMMRYILDNFANLQINIFLLFCSLVCIHLFIRKQYAWLGLLLGFTIALKVYTIFFLLYFVFKREFKPVLWTLLFVGVFTMTTFLVFGYDLAIEYHQYWFQEVTQRSYANHKNQSIFGTFLRFLTTEDPSHDLFVNFASMTAEKAKSYTYMVVVLIALFPAYLFRKKLTDYRSLGALLEYTTLFTVIPILSPIAWKAYFIFLWVPYTLVFVLLYRTTNKLPNRPTKIMKALFWSSAILTIFSTELFVGNHFSDVLEAYSAITLGTILLLVIQLYLFQKKSLFDLNETIFQIRPKKEAETKS